MTIVVLCRAAESIAYFDGGGGGGSSYGGGCDPGSFRTYSGTYTAFTLQYVQLEILSYDGTRENDLLCDWTR